MSEVYFKVGDTNFNPDDDQYKGIALETTNGVNAAINIGGIVLSNNATPENPDPQDKELLVNGEPIGGGEDIRDENNVFTGNNTFELPIEAEGIGQTFYDEESGEVIGGNGIGFGEGVGDSIFITSGDMEQSSEIELNSEVIYMNVFTPDNTTFGINITPENIHINTPELLLNNEPIGDGNQAKYLVAPDESTGNLALYTYDMSSGEMVPTPATVSDLLDDIVNHVNPPYLFYTIDMENMKCFYFTDTDLSTGISAVCGNEQLNLAADGTITFTTKLSRIRAEETQKISDTNISLNQSEATLYQLANNNGSLLVRHSKDNNSNLDDGFYIFIPDYIDYSDRWIFRVTNGVGGNSLDIHITVSENVSTNAQLYIGTPIE